MGQKKSFADVEDVLVGLMGVVTAARGGEQRISTAYPYARTVLAGAEASLKKLDLYDKARHAIDESERLILAGHFDEADKLLCETAREMMERSGTNDRLRKLYAPKGSTRKQ